MNAQASIFRLIPLVLYLALLTWGSLASANTVRQVAVLGWDKLLHFCGYGVLTFVALYAAPLLPVHPSLRPWFVAGSVCVYGALLEWAQGTMHLGRTTEITDILANILGTGISLLVATGVQRARSPQTARGSDAHESAE